MVLDAQSSLTFLLLSQVEVDCSSFQKAFV